MLLWHRIIVRVYSLTVKMYVMASMSAGKLKRGLMHLIVFEDDNISVWKDSMYFFSLENDVT